VKSLVSVYICSDTSVSFRGIVANELKVSCMSSSVLTGDTSSNVESMMAAAMGTTRLADCET
jgi:hypothetical protein